MNLIILKRRKKKQTETVKNFHFLLVPCASDHAEIRIRKRRNAMIGKRKFIDCPVKEKKIDTCDVCVCVCVLLHIYGQRVKPIKPILLNSESSVERIVFCSYNRSHEWFHYIDSSFFFHFNLDSRCIVVIVIAAVVGTECTRMNQQRLSSKTGRKYMFELTITVYRRYLRYDATC